MATKFRSPRRWEDYQINKALCFVVMAVFACVLLLGFASSSLTSYFAQRNINRNGYVSAYSKIDGAGNLYPPVDVDGVYIDPYHYNATITTTLKSSNYDKFAYLRLEVSSNSNLTPGTNYAKLKSPKDGTFCILNTVDSQYPLDQLPTCTLDDALAWSSCDSSNCPSNFGWVEDTWGDYYIYFYIYPRQPLEDDINIDFQFFGNFDTVHSESSVNFALFTSYLFVALALVIPFVLLVAAIVAKKLRKPFPVDEPDDDHDHHHLQSNSNVVDEFCGEELATFSSIN